MENKEFEVRLAEYNRQIARQKMRRLRLAHHALGYRPSADRVRGEKMTRAEFLARRKSEDRKEAEA